MQNNTLQHIQKKESLTDQLRTTTKMNNTKKINYIVEAHRESIFKLMVMRWTIPVSVQ